MRSLTTLVASWLVASWALILAAAGNFAGAAEPACTWPPVTAEARPWAYNWWLGSAVDEKNLARELAHYHEAGLGGIHVIPIYGANGYEDRYVDFLSRRWMELFAYTVHEADRLGMGVDMTTGTGWCFGGPDVKGDEAGMIVECKPIHIAKGETWKFAKGETRQAPLKPSSLLALLAVGDDGVRQDLSPQFVAPGTAPADIRWTAQQQAVTLYPLVLRGRGPKVKRAAPGGQGFMLNPFNGAAMENYLHRFTEAFPLDRSASAAVRPRAMYHDSYEYRSLWSPDLFAEFEKRRGYRLQEHLPELFGNRQEEASSRVRCDYSETLSDLMIDKFIPPWINWCKARGMLVRYQAHGSPGNLLDLYALADVPETEMFGRGDRNPLVSQFEPGMSEVGDRNILVSKFASSAAHTAGHRLVASETGTWMAEHFCETLEEMKCLIDSLFVAGINHVFYHGCCYSPDEAPWPGWLFYAATEMNPRNPIWHDVPALNAYIARCQSVLQAGQPDNDVLVYWPIHDYWSTPRSDLAAGLVVHNRGKAWLGDQPIGPLASRLWKRGYAFDYVSDRQLNSAQCEDGKIAMPGGKYRVIVVPPARHVPVETIANLRRLMVAGGTVIFAGEIPSDVPGLGDMERRKQQLAAERGPITAKMTEWCSTRCQTVEVGSGRAIWGDVEQSLAAAKVPRKALTDQAGVMVIRRRLGEGRYYFIAHQGATAIDGWMPLGFAGEEVYLLDPMTGEIHRAATRPSPKAGNLAVEIYLQLSPGASTIVFSGKSSRHSPGAVIASMAYSHTTGAATPLRGEWTVRFIEGGPTLPRSFTTNVLGSWTASGDPQTQAFGGTAVYSLDCDAPGAERALLDLGKVCHSARVRLNGQLRATLIMPPYRVVLDGWKPHENHLEVEVTNLAANRIRDLDRRKVPWRVFHDANVVSLTYRGFDASKWPLFDSGLLGPVTLTPVAVGEPVK